MEAVLLVVLWIAASFGWWLYRTAPERRLRVAKAADERTAARRRARVRVEREESR